MSRLAKPATIRQSLAPTTFSCLEGYPCKYLSATTMSIRRFAFSKRSCSGKVSFAKCANGNIMRSHRSSAPVKRRKVSVARASSPRKSWIEKWALYQWRSGLLNSRKCAMWSGIYRRWSANINLPALTSSKPRSSASFYSYISRLTRFCLDTWFSWRAVKWCDDHPQNRSVATARRKARSPAILYRQADHSLPSEQVAASPPRRALY